MYFLERFLAIFLGITVLPLRVLVYNALYAMSALLIGVAFMLGLPLMLALTLNHEGIPKAVNMIMSTFIVFPITVVATAVAFALLTGYLLCSTLIYTLSSLGLGFKNGLLYGMNGFWTALSRQQIISQDASNLFRTFLVSAGGEGLTEGNDFVRVQRVGERWQDLVVVHENLDVPDLQSKEPRAPPVLLSASELNKIEALIEQLTYFKEPLAQPIKAQLVVLKTLCSQYKDLFCKLEEVRLALVNNDRGKIKDELIAYNKVNIPILLVKQYAKDGFWYNVPAASYVGDRDSFLYLLKKSALHPLHKDRFKKPEPYEQMETRYIWHELTENDCSFQELNHLVVEIRVLVDRLLPQLSALQGSKLFMKEAPQTFFSLVTNAHVPSLQLEYYDGLQFKGTR